MNVAQSELAHLCQGDEEVAMQSVVTKIRNPKTGLIRRVSILLDCASKRTYLSQRVAKKLELTPRRQLMRKVCTFVSDKPQDVQLDISDFEILGVNGQYIGLTGNVVQGDITSCVSLGDIPLSLNDQTLIKTIPMADPYFQEARDFQLDVLIGNDFLPMLMRKGQLKLEKSGVYLFETQLGWVTSGLINGGGACETTGIEPVALWWSGPVRASEGKKEWPPSRISSL